MILVKRPELFFSFNSKIYCGMRGLTAVAAQVILPFVAHLTPLETRGQMVGNVMSGLFLGIMLSRPIASFLSYIFTWQAVFIFLAVFMLLLVFLLKHFFPKRKPEHNLSYGQLIASFPMLFKSYPVLQRRAIYHALLFLVLNLFWTSIATLLMGNFFKYTQEKVALFALVGAMGALAAPIAGRLADKGWTRAATGIAILLVCVSCLISQWHHGHSIVALVIAAIVLDIGAACNLVLGQRSIYALAPEIRGRLNALYVALFFMGGAIGSGLSGYLYKIGGWSAIADTGLIISSFTFIYFLTEYRHPEW